MTSSFSPDLRNTTHFSLLGHFRTTPGAHERLLQIGAMALLQLGPTPLYNFPPFFNLPQFGLGVVTTYLT